MQYAHGVRKAWDYSSQIVQTKEYTYVCSRMTILNIKCTKEANSDFLIPISVQPDVRDLQYFKLKIMLDKLI